MVQAAVTSCDERQACGESRVRDSARTTHDAAEAAGPASHPNTGRQGRPTATGRARRQRYDHCPERRIDHGWAWGRGPFPFGNHIDAAPDAAGPARRCDPLLINTDQHHRRCRPALPHQTHVAQQQRPSTSDHRRQARALRDRAASESAMATTRRWDGRANASPWCMAVWTSDADKPGCFEIRGRRCERAPPLWSKAHRRQPTDPRHCRAPRIRIS